MGDVKVIGRYPILERKPTGLYSLDWCLGSRGEHGAPLRSLYEVYGYPNSGKSTLSYYLAGALSPTPEITICDLENLDVNYLKTAVGASVFTGEVHLVDSMTEDNKPRTHETMLTELAVKLNNSSGSCILDSVGAIQSMVEQSVVNKEKESFGEAYMGKRAKLVAQMSRALSGIVRIDPLPKTAFVINHVHQIMGSRGHATAGGVVLTHMAAVRIMIWGKEQFTVSEEDPRPIGYLVEGKTEKLRFGGRGRTFSFYIVPGLGVHPGASAMFDCFDLGLAERKATIKMDGKSMGYLKKEFLDYAESGKVRKFDPFVEALQKYQETELKWGIEEKEENVIPTSKAGKGKAKVQPPEPS